MPIPDDKKDVFDNTVFEKLLNFEGTLIDFECEKKFPPMRSDEAELTRVNALERYMFSVAKDINARYVAILAQICHMRPENLTDEALVAMQLNESATEEEKSLLLTMQEEAFFFTKIAWRLIMLRIRYPLSAKKIDLAIRKGGIVTIPKTIPANAPNINVS